jgi:hypothetical protein
MAIRNKNRMYVPHLFLTIFPIGSIIVPPRIHALHFLDNAMDGSYRKISQPFF